MVCQTVTERKQPECPALRFTFCFFISLLRFELHPLPLLPTNPERGGERHRRMVMTVSSLSVSDVFAELLCACAFASVCKCT